MDKPSLLLYIHGFNSSPKSMKADIIKQYVDQFRPDIKLVTPQMACHAGEAKQQLLDLISQYQKQYQIGLVGSSLGGYLSTWLNSLYGYRAVLVNPAVKPYELLQDYLGEQVNPYTNERYTLTYADMEHLKELYVPCLSSPQDFWLLQQTGDEVLDYRQAVDKYQQSKQTIEQGGDHSFVGFERYPQAIVEFLEL